VFLPRSLRQAMGDLARLQAPAIQAALRNLTASQAPALRQAMGDLARLQAPAIPRQVRPDSPNTALNIRLYPELDGAVRLHDMV
jgi:hypothetical protein